MNFKVAFVYEADGKTVKTSSLSDDNFSLKIKKSDNRITVALDAKKEMRVKQFMLKFDHEYAPHHRIFCNGYQSWTVTQELFPHQKMRGINPIYNKLIDSPFMAKTGLNRAGDETWYKYPHKKGVFYGYSYGYVADNDTYKLFGSLSERSGYTIVEFDANKNSIVVKKELEGVTFFGEKELLDLAILEGEYEATFDKYFEMMGVKSRCDKRCSGYTTWYNYYGGVTEDIVFNDLKSLSALEKKVNIFQIDDGYQAAIGDWLETDTKKFPGGMKVIADEIHKNDMLAGLWLAPFAAVKSSKLFQEHRDWFIKDENGEPYICGPNWGVFYGLDLYNEEAREYIRHFFDVILNEWGYDMVKLDFLYAACVRPMYNKTRGEIMCDAMDFIRECCGDKLILGCGVPLMPAFGKVDFCRIGSDVALDWRVNNWTHREDVSTPYTLNDTIFRRHLDGRAFQNDPDVYLLRDNNINLSFDQRRLISKINSLFGSLLFISDDVSKYNEAQMNTFLETAFSNKAKIISARYISEEDIAIEYELDGKRHSFQFNVYKGKMNYASL